MSFDDDSKLFTRTVGRRARPAPGRPPSATARAAMASMACYRTAVPKGVFIYPSHEAANADWERWRIGTMRARSLVKVRDD
jgi:hypothetical protein